ncbi:MULTISPECIES: histidine phosphatase family protein [Rhizobium/Agrobacterium group]|uniref:Fructose-2,6-bisphosphatase n=2 Tax=Agrobacterium TaxID=357 RepID=A0A1S7NNR4_9HYPH|nr:MULTISPECIES: histidine phosphatase family protein [Rhizobium/Agrobacterium group]KRA60717.1 phosphoglycerate kinase [Rhizobium sp. Root651]QCL89579.1 histidine phosphatase family protein [Agrobacterium tumefaciens]TKT66623.1 histidine phosphatase family protein [Agrobacterium sp. LC34]CUX09579.1 Fructose-2,6-bisphosphatase [Agrobacterium tomkonis CFBP 6623]
MKNIFVVTHTQSVHHVENKVGGWYDTELTPKGRADAEATAAKLTAMIGNAPVEIFSSDLLRASQTAAIIAEHLKHPFESTDDLREISYGSAGGMPQEWLDARQIPAPHHNRMDHRGGIADGETRREVAERVYRSVNTIISRPCPAQVIVTHGFALTFVIAAWIKMPIESVGHVSFPARSGSITHLKEDDYWQNRAVVSLADVSHLTDDDG